MKTTAFALLCASLLVACHPAVAETTTPNTAPPGLNLADTPFAASATPAPNAQPQIVVLPAPVIPPPPQSLGANITAWGMLLTAAISMLFALVGYALKKCIELKPVVEELRGRQDRQAQKQGQITGTVTQLLAAAPPTQIVPPPVISNTPSAPVLAFLVACTAFFATACSTTGPDPAKNIRNAGFNAAGTAALKGATKVLGNVATVALMSAAQQEFSGGNVDWGSAAAQGAWSQATANTTGAVIGSVIAANTEGRGRQTAIEAQKAATAALDHGKQPAAVAGAIATVISTVAGAPPAL